MAAKPKVPFALHPAARLRCNLELAETQEVALSPDGTTAAVLHGTWPQRQLDFYDLRGDALPEVVMPPSTSVLEHFTWSRDGRQWAVVAPRYEGNERPATVHVGRRDVAAPRVQAALEDYGTVTRNAQTRSSSTLAFSPDGGRLVVRVSGRDERSALLHIALPEGTVRAQWFDPIDVDHFGHGFSDDGTLYVACANPGAIAGTMWFAPGAEAPTGHLRWPYGFAVLPGQRGLWVVGAPSVAFRLGPGKSDAIVSAQEARQTRAETLQLRASVAWDVQNAAHLVERLRSPGNSYLDRPARHTHGLEVVPPPTEGMRCFEHELLWETALAAPLGDDDVVICDGIATYLWRDQTKALHRTLLVDDLQRCTTRAPRIVGISAAGDTFALLWKKDARGSKTVLSVFDLDRSALEV